MTINHSVLAASAALLLAACTSSGETESTAPALSEQDRAEAHAQMFADLDADHSSALSPTELEAGGDHGQMLLAHLGEIDRSGDGALSMEEIGAAMAQRHGGEHGREKFDAADTDHDGKLSLAELQAAPAPGPMLADHLDDIDTDGDGALSHDEIRAAMEQHHHPAP